MKWLRKTKTSTSNGISSSGLFASFQTYKHLETCKRRISSAQNTSSRASWHRSEDVTNLIAPGGAFAARRKLKDLTNSHDLQARRLARKIQRNNLPRLKRAVRLGLVPLLVLLTFIGFW
jgi:hypothetical protein